MYTKEIAAITILAATAQVSAAGLPSLKRQEESTNPNLGTNPDAQGATNEVTPGAGPNGAESWFNTGIDDNSGWQPPYLNFDSLIHIDTESFYGGAGGACAQYDQYFQSAGSKFNVDPAILACIAMQESSCNHEAGGPTPGLMQVACSNYPNGECTPWDIQSNVDAGSNYLRSQLDSSDNNAIVAFGSYNGFFQGGSGMNGDRGLTQDYPCSEEGQSNGAPQNLDYLQETLNGWLLGLNPYGEHSWIGTYDCSGQCGNGDVC